MTEIVLNADQSKQIAEAGEGVLLRSANGGFLGYLTPGRDYSPEEIKAAQSELEAGRLGIPTAELLARFPKDVTREEIAEAKQHVAERNPDYTSWDVIAYLRAKKRQ